MAPPPPLKLPPLGRARSPSASVLLAKGLRTRLMSCSTDVNTHDE